MPIPDYQTLMLPMMQFLADDLRPSAFHTARFHYHRVLQWLREPFGKVEQREGDAEQQGLPPLRLGTPQHIGQLGVLVEVGAAQRVLRGVDQPLCHVHQRTPLPFQIGGKQREDAPFDVGPRAGYLPHLDPLTIENRDLGKDKDLIR